nr:28S ribosomal protein S14, mitochondrial-like [Ciona intestinalis]|eukprot:XP_009861742.1 28S ribosomal protein S14, mitochondrial-like [Ciona intestinalis]
MFALKYKSLSQELGKVTKVNLTQTRLVASKRKKPYRFKTCSTAKNHVGGPKPPTTETVAYLALPEAYDPVLWGKKGDANGKNCLWHVNWLMQRDNRRRHIATYYGALYTRLQCIRYSGHLPLELKQVADQETSGLPRGSDKNWTVNRCVVTSRPRGNKDKWRISRMVFRHFADHGKMSGVKRAMW